MATIQDVRKATQDAKDAREAARTALDKVTAAGNKGTALEPKNAAVAAAGLAGLKSQETFVHAVDVNKAEARDLARDADQAATDAHAAALDAVKLFSEKKD